VTTSVPPSAPSAASGPPAGHEAPIPTITRDELRRGLKDRSLVVVNVLPRESFLNGRIAGSINVPLAEMPERAPELFPEKSGEIVTYCSKPT